MYTAYASTWQVREAEFTGSITIVRVRAPQGSHDSICFACYISRNEWGERVSMKLPSVPWRLRDGELQLTDPLKAENLWLCEQDTWAPAWAQVTLTKHHRRWLAFPWHFSLGMLALPKQELSSAVMFAFGGFSMEKNESFRIFYQQTKAFKQWGNMVCNDEDQALH